MKENAKLVNQALEIVQKQLKDYLLKNCNKIFGPDTIVIIFGSLTENQKKIAQKFKNNTITLLEKLDFSSIIRVYDFNFRIISEKTDIDNKVRSYLHIMRSYRNNISHLGEKDIEYDDTIEALDTSRKLLLKLGYEIEAKIVSNLLQSFREEWSEGKTQAEEKTLEKTETKKQIKKKYDYVVGIDLGTTVSIISYKDLEKDNTIKILELKQEYVDGREISQIRVPSVVYYDRRNKKYYVGLGAEEKKFKALKDVNVFYSSKSDIGKKVIYHRSITSEIQYPFQVSSKILEFLIESFKIKITSDLSKCKIIITVPASFGSTQRNDTIKSAKKAKINIDEGSLIDEPNAAFIAYIKETEQNRIFTEGSKVLVFDMGGGTTDLSLIEIQSVSQNYLDVRNLAVSRYDLLGGDDIDAHIAYEYLYPNFLEQNEIEDDTFSIIQRDKIIFTRLKKIAKNLKEQISIKLNWYINNYDIESINKITWELFPDIHDVKVSVPDEIIKIRNQQYKISNISLSAIEFINLMKPFIDHFGTYDDNSLHYNKISFYSLIKRMLHNSEISADTIDYILAIGGSSINPVILVSLQSYFQNSKILIPKEMDLLVTKGAVYFGEQIVKNNVPPIVPVIADQIGILTEGEFFKPIINAGITVPYPKEKSKYIISDELYLPYDDINEIHIPICVGNKNRIYQVIKLSRFDFDIDSLKIAMRINKDKILEFKILANNEEFPYNLENTITFFKTGDKQLDKLELLLYQYRKSVIEKDGKEQINQFNVARQYLEISRFKEAIEYFEDLLKKTKDQNLKGQIYINLSICYGRFNNFKRAIDWIEFYLHIFPISPTALYNLGIYYLNVGEKENAFNVWEKSIKEGNALAACYIMFGSNIYDDNKEKGEELIKEGIKRYSAEEISGSFDCGMLSMAYQKLGQESIANKWKEKEIELYIKDKKFYDPESLLKETGNKMEEDIREVDW